MKYCKPQAMKVVNMGGIGFNCPPKWNNMIAVCRVG